MNFKKLIKHIMPLSFFKIDPTVKSSSSVAS